MSSSEITPADSTSPITEGGIARLRERLGAYYGSGPHFIDITADDIRRYAQSNGDRNKLYLDQSYARHSRYGGLIAPNTFLDLAQHYTATAIDCAGYPWYAKLFMKPHIEIENDPSVWSKIEALIQTKVFESQVL